MMNQTVTNKIERIETASWKNWIPKRGEVYLVDLGENNIDSEQKGIRPALILSNDKNNKYSSIIQIAPITSQKKNDLPVHVKLNHSDGMKTESIVCIEQAKCISKRRAFVNGIIVKITELTENKMREVDCAIKIQFSIN